MINNTNTSQPACYIFSSSQNLTTQESNDESTIIQEIVSNSTSLEKQEQAEIQQQLISAHLLQNVKLSEELQKGNRIEVAPLKELCSDEEWMNIEIGCAVLQDRVKQRQKALTCLRDKNISLDYKQMVCMYDFGSIPAFFEGKIIPQLGIDVYCNYLTVLLEHYKIIERLIQLITSATTQAEKNTHQNNLYYFLSCEKECFKEFVSNYNSYPIPKHANEDDFYDIICLKLCDKATKEYDVLNKYLKFEKVDKGHKMQIDNRKLRDEYISKHTEIKKEFNKSCPIFWLGSINDNMNKTSEKQINNIIESLSQCGDKVIEITDKLAKQIEIHEVKTDDLGDYIISVYHEFGSLILDTIKGYESVEKKIKSIEKETIKWLENFKEKNNLFRKLSLEEKALIRDYLQVQKEKERCIELEKREIVKRASAAIQALNKSKNEQKKLMKASSLLLNNQNAAFQQPIRTKTIESKSEAISEPIFSLPIEKPIEKNISQLPSFEHADGNMNLPKTKFKTRPLQAPRIEDKIEVKEKEAVLTLPEHLKNEEFNFFIESLMAETKPNKLKNSFKKLNDFGIFAENNEKNNKGYFCVKSPITNQVHVCTYHHLHNSENYYASIFMAVRQVLIAADILER
ncbi:MAG: hypothetical protein H0V82_05650 [Candidatus Protochlamydia sp.]|nr:hypothetical protein [Candidatus Protochlamydia sp.]